MLPDPQVPELPSIAALLSRARGHERLRAQLANRRVRGLPAPDYAGATTSAQLALSLREQAASLDPHCTDPAWAEDRLSPAAQMDWLRAYIARP